MTLVEFYCCIIFMRIFKFPVSSNFGDIPFSKKVCWWHKEQENHNENWVSIPHHSIDQKVFFLVFFLVFSCFLSVYAVTPRSHPVFPTYWLVLLGICFSRPSAPKILSLLFQGIGWCDRDEILKFSTKVYFKNTTYIINRRIFWVLFVQGTFST